MQGFVYSDLTMSFKAAVNGVSPETTPSVSDAENNSGYRFVGWYREPDVTVNVVDESHDFFDPIVSDEAKRVGDAVEYTAENTGPGKYDHFTGNDLFVAAMEAQVRYHDVTGVVVDHAGAPDATGDDDWCKYEDALPQAAEPQADRANGVSVNAQFIGWTTIQPENGGGWAAISASDLADIVNAGEFYQAGDPVLKPMDLYPVYLDRISNIMTVCEGNEQDSLDDPTKREGVASTNAVADVLKPMDLYPVYLDRISNIMTVCEGNEQDSLDDPTKREGVASTNAVAEGDKFTIRVEGAAVDGALPAGYRFLGWYEVGADGREWRVSTDPFYTLPADVDLSKQHTYTARFEYRVDGWLPVRYEVGADGREWRVSTDPFYTLPADVDLSKQHTYTARFEYRVDGWLPVRLPNVTGSGEYGYKEYFEKHGLQLNGLYATAWLPYQATGAQVAAELGTPSVRGTFHYWTDHENIAVYPAYSDDFILSSDELNAIKGTSAVPALPADSPIVTSPFDVDAVVEYHGFYDVVTFTDFPGCANRYELSIDGLGRGNIDIEARGGYRYSGVVRFSTEVGNDPDLASRFNHNETDFKGDWNGTSLSWVDSSHVYEDDYQNVYLLKASADVNFYDLEGRLERNVLELGGFQPRV